MSGGIGYECRGRNTGQCTVLYGMLRPRHHVARPGWWPV